LNHRHDRVGVDRIEDQGVDALVDKVDHHRRLGVGVAIRVGVEQGHSRKFGRRVYDALGHALEERIGERRNVVTNLDRLTFGESRCPNERGCNSGPAHPHKFTTIRDETPWLLPRLRGTLAAFP
jgi:hypothetical protein